MLNDKIRCVALWLAFEILRKYLERDDKSKIKNLDLRSLFLFATIARAF